MNPVRKFAVSAIIASTTLAGMAQTYGDVPAYNAHAPVAGSKLPPILNATQLPQDTAKYPFVAKAYAIAARIQRTLFQLPCYCHCDRSVGHNSLRSCFADDHGAHCETCLQELFYANEMIKQGKTAKQIRDGIERGEWQKIDLNKV